MIPTQGGCPGDGAKSRPGGMDLVHVLWEGAWSGQTEVRGRGWLWGAAGRAGDCFRASRLGWKGGKPVEAEDSFWCVHLFLLLPVKTI